MMIEGIYLREETMSKNKNLTFFIFIILLFVNLTNALAFSNANFKGAYAMQITGLSTVVLANNSQTVGTGWLFADGNGNINGHGVFRSGGISCIGSIVGKYNLNADGTGSIASIFFPTTPGCFRSVFDLGIVLANNGANFKLASTENDYLTGKLTKTEKRKFLLSDFRGTYALQLVGPSSIANASQPFTVGIGLLTADGNGKITGIATFRSFGTTCRGTITGIYNVTPDGTGFITSNFILQNSPRDTFSPPVIPQEAFTQRPLSQQPFPRRTIPQEPLPQESINQSRGRGGGTFRQLPIVEDRERSSVFVRNDQATNRAPNLNCFNTVINLSFALFSRGNLVEVTSFDNDYMAGSLERQLFF